MKLKPDDIIFLVLIGFMLGLLTGYFCFSSPSSEAKGSRTTLTSGFFELKERKVLPSSPSAAPLRSFDDLLDAIEWAESNGDANAVGHNGKAIGAYQIQKIYVDDVNRILGKNKYIYADRWDRNKSQEMAEIYLKYYQEKALHICWSYKIIPTDEELLQFAAQIHNGGPKGWQKESTKAYWRKVKEKLYGALATEGWRSLEK